MTDRTEILAIAKRQGDPNTYEALPKKAAMRFARAVKELVEENERLRTRLADWDANRMIECDRLRKELSKEKHEAVCAETVARNYAAERDRLREELDERIAERAQWAVRAQRAEEALAELTRKDKQLCEQNGSLLMELATARRTHEEMNHEKHLKIMDLTETARLASKELAALKAEIKAAPELRNTSINGQVFGQGWSTTKAYGDTHRCLGFRIEPLEKK